MQVPSRWGGKKFPAGVTLEMGSVFAGSWGREAVLRGQAEDAGSARRREDSPLWLEHRKLQGRPRAEVSDRSRNGFWEITGSH